MKSLTQISREENVSVSTVLRILEQIIITNKVYNLEEIYLDEFKGDANGEKYQLAIYDKNHRLVSILKDRKSSTLKAFLNENKDIIKVVSIDMFMQFNSFIETFLRSSTFFRNAGAHNKRFYDLTSKNSFSTKNTNLDGTNNQKLYALYVELKFFLIKYDYDNFNNNIKKIITDLEKELKVITINKILNSMGFPNDWHKS